MKRSGFKMRSGNSPLAFKLMGSSPLHEDKQKKPTQEELIKQAEAQFGDGVQVSGGKKTVKHGSNYSYDFGTETPKLQEDKTHVIKLDQTIGANQPRKEGYVTEELGPTSDNSGDQSEVKEKEDGWKFDIDWDEVGTEAIKTGVKMGIAALSAGTKKPPRRSGSIGSFAAHKFGTNTDITKS
jgi:uncharacterized GH25 family protein